jgi:recombination protein RecA
MAPALTTPTSLSTLTSLELLLREKKLDVTLTSSRPWLRPGASRDEREARLSSSGWASIDAALGGGFPRGECSEIVGPASCGRTAVLSALLAAAGEREEVMALVDTFDRFDPVSAATMGVDLSRLLWVRGTGLAQPTVSQPILPQPIVPPRSGARERDLLARVIDRAIKSFGLVLQAGGFGVVALDLADVPMAAIRRLPFTTWLRAQRLIEGRDTVGIVLARDPIARSARGVTLRLARDGASEATWTGDSPHARLFAGFTLRPHVASAHRIGEEERESSG